MADLSRRARILVIEDDPIIALTLRLLLTQLGHSVIGPFTTATQARRAKRWDQVVNALGVSRSARTRKLAWEQERAARYGRRHSDDIQGLEAPAQH
jgi:CheY-like chemotaxis protein